MSVGRPLLVPSHISRWIDGTVAAPSGAFANDLNTGIYSPGADIFGIVTGGVERMRFGSAGAVFINDTSNDSVTIGLIINQGPNDDNIFSLKSSDVATGITSALLGASGSETDDFLLIRKQSATLGGVIIVGLGENDVGQESNMRFFSAGGQAGTTKSTAGRSLVEFYATQHDGANALADITSNGNIFGLRARRAAADDTIVIYDADGDLWLLGALSVSADHAGITGSVTLTNQVDNTANSTGVGTILFKGTTSRNSSGFLKVMDGTTARYIPYFNAITA